MYVCIQVDIEIHRWWLQGSPLAASRLTSPILTLYKGKRKDVNECMYSYQYMYTQSPYRPFIDIFINCMNIDIHINIQACIQVDVEIHTNIGTHGYIHGRK